MNLFTRIILGLAIAGVGVFLVFKTAFMVDFFGDVEWADRHLGSTSLFYKLLGVLISFIGFMVATDLWDAFLTATLGGLFPQHV